MTTLTIAAETLRRQAVNILTAWGMGAEHAEITAEILIEADLRGVESHGLSMLPVYQDMLFKINLKPNIRVVKELPVAALIDADHSLGQVASKLACDMAIAKARANGIGLISVRRSQHFGAAGCYTEMIVRAGLIGFAFTSARGLSMVPTNGTEPIIGTNPIAFAAPAGRNNPFSLDMATTPVAVNKLKVYWLKGKELPEGWAYKPDGTTERNAEQAFKNKRMAPLGGSRESGGYKGYGLAMMVNILSSTLSGAAFQPLRLQREGPTKPDNIGHFFLAIDPALFREDGEFEHDLDEMIDFLHAQKPADPDHPVLVPGDPEYAEREKRVAAGIPIPQMLADQIKAICHKTGAGYVLDKN